MSLDWSLCTPFSHMDIGLYMWAYTPVFRYGGTVQFAMYANVERVTLVIDSSTRHEVKALPIIRQNYPDDGNLLMSQGQ